MKYTTEEALAEILRRGEQVSRRRERQVRRALSGAAGLCFAALVLVIGLMPGQRVMDFSDSTYGAFLLPSAAGGYVLAALLAFAAGVIITLLIIRGQRRSDTRDGTDDYGQDQNAAAPIAEAESIQRTISGLEVTENE